MKYSEKTILLALVLCCLSVPAVGQPNDPSTPDPGLGDGLRSRGLNALAERLNLSPEQVASLRELRHGFWEETAEEKEALFKKKDELALMFKDQKTNDTDILAKKKEMTALRDQVEEKAMGYRLKARKILTPEQLAQLPPGCGLGFAPGGGHDMWHGKRRGPNHAQGGPCLWGGS